MSRGGDIYGVGKQDHTTKIGVSHVVPLLKLVANKGDPMRLGYNTNHQVGTREQVYKPSPFFPSNPPTNTCPNLSRISKQKIPNCIMKNHTFRVGRPTFKHTTITDGRGHIMASSGGREWRHIEQMGLLAVY